MRDRHDLAHLRQDEIRSLVRDYFQTMLDRYLEKMNDTGFARQSIEHMKDEISVHENAAEGQEKQD